MYNIREHKDVDKLLVKKRLPKQVMQKYIAWKRIVELQGPQDLNKIRGFNDEALEGEWMGFRSSRLSKKWRVIYKVEKRQPIVYVMEINPHKY